MDTTPMNDKTAPYANKRTLDMSDLWTLRDIDNRDDSGEPWETTGTAAELADYIDGPLLSDLTDPEDAGEEIEDIATRMRSDTWDDYDRLRLEHSGVYIRKVETMTATMTREDVIRIISYARSNGERPNLCDADLSNLNLSNLDLSNIDLDDANLSSADLSGAYLIGASLYGADLDDANLSSADLSGAYLTGADLTGADMTGASLYGANLADADLRGSNLTDASLYGADLTGADMTGADMRGADLRGVNLTDADLTGANLEETHE